MARWSETEDVSAVQQMFSRIVVATTRPLGTHEDWSTVLRAHGFDESLGWSPFGLHDLVHGEPERWDERLDRETNGPRIRAADDPANVYALDAGWIDGCTSHNKVLTTVYNAVLPRDANGRPIDPIDRFPQNDTADVHNTVERGELTDVVA